MFDVVEEQMEQSEIGQYTTYGLCVTSGDRKLTLHDLTPNRKDLLAFVEILRRNEVSIDHVEDVVSDSIGILF